jgi:hypothetical protein
MIEFICTEDSCESKDIKNTFLGNSKLAICAGCNSVVIGENEQPDPEISAEQE